MDLLASSASWLHIVARMPGTESRHTRKDVELSPEERSHAWAGVATKGQEIFKPGAERWEDEVEYLQKMEGSEEHYKDATHCWARQPFLCEWVACLKIF